MHNMGHENEEEDDDNTNNDNGDDDGYGGDDVSQQQQTVIRDHPRTIRGRCHKIREQQPLTNQVQQDRRPQHISRRTCCGTSSHY